MARFDSDRYKLYLAQARQDLNLDIQPGPGPIRFDPQKHPRDTKGRFRDVVGGLRIGEQAILPDGVHVRRTQDSFEIGQGRLGRQQVRSPEEAADKAFARSATPGTGPTTNVPSRRPTGPAPASTGRRSYGPSMREMQAEMRVADDKRRHGKSADSNRDRDHISEIQDYLDEAASHDDGGHDDFEEAFGGDERLLEFAEGGEREIPGARFGREGRHGGIFLTLPGGTRVQYDGDAKVRVLRG